jgi:hypothetical protein
VKKIQAGYTAQTLSAFTHQPALPVPAIPDFPKFTEDAFKTEFPAYLNFLLQSCPPVDEEKALRPKFATIGIEAGKPFVFDKLSDAQKGELGLGVKEGYASIEKQCDNIGKNINGLDRRISVWRSSFLSRKLPAARRRNTRRNLWQQRGRGHVPIGKKRRCG